MKRSHATAVAGVLVTAVAASLTACGGDDESYTLPKKLCGTPVKSEPLRRLLPDGKKLATKKDDRGLGDVNCHVTVDGASVLNLGEAYLPTWHDPTKTPSDELDPAPVDLPYEGKARVNDDRTVVVVPCGSTRSRYLLVLAEAEHPPKDLSLRERRAATKDLAVAATPHLKKRRACP